MKVDIRKIAIIIIGFLYIYVPPLFPISTTGLLSVLFILYCFVKYWIYAVSYKYESFTLHSMVLYSNAGISNMCIYYVR